MKLTKRKLAQFARVDSSVELRRRVAPGKNLMKKRKHSSSPRFQVFRAKVEGITRFLKFAPKEDQQRQNISNILKAHKWMAKQGYVKAEHYHLAPNPYLWAGENVGVMRDLGNISLKQLTRFLLLAKTHPNHAKRDGPHLLKFAKKHGITYRKAQDAQTEFQKDLEKINQYFETFHTDVRIGDNAWITGWNAKEEKFVISLIDQISPGVVRYGK